VALDIDVSPFDNSMTKKEGVSRTYMGIDGYAPIPNLGTFNLSRLTKHAKDFKKKAWWQL